MLRFGPSELPLGGPRGGMAPGRIGSSGYPSSLGNGIGGSNVRRSSNVVFSESRRFCSAALCDVLRRTGGGREDEVIELEVYIFPAIPRKISAQLEGVIMHKLPGNMGFRLGLTSVTPLPFLV